MSHVWRQRHRSESIRLQSSFMQSGTIGPGISATHARSAPAVTFQSRSQNFIPGHVPAAAAADACNTLRFGPPPSVLWLACAS
eukprot:1506049-Rhodomonas_salina.1